MRVLMSPERLSSPWDYPVALAGLAGAIEVTALNHRHELGFSVGYGFDAIAIALLGKNHPVGVVLASLLFAAMRNGATRMQFLTQIPVDVISIIQALILLFVAADAIVRYIYRIRAPSRTCRLYSRMGKIGALLWILNDSVLLP